MFSYTNSKVKGQTRADAWNGKQGLFFTVLASK